MADITKTLQIVISAKDEATKTISGMSGNLQSFSKDMRVLGVGMAAIGAGAVAMGKSFVDASGYVQVQRTAMRTLIGDTELANKTYQDLVEMASKTPFEIPQILEQSKRLLAMGTSAEDLTKTFEMLGNVASGVGMEKLPQLVLAFGQIQAKGRLMGTELRQLTEAGFNLADAMGVTNAELEEMIANGEVGFEDVKSAFQNVTAEGGRFHGLMGEIAKTTPGQLSNLSDNVFKLKAALGDSLIPAVNQLLQILVPFVEKLSEWATEHPNLIAGMVAVALVIGAIGTAILILGPIITGLIATWGVLSAVVSGAIGVIGAIIGILGGPLTIIILAIMALVASLALAWRTNFLGIRDHVNNFVNWFKNTAWPTIQLVFELIKIAVKAVTQQWIDRFNLVKSTIEGVINTIKRLISVAQEMAGKISGGLKIPGFQHGGFVPGGSGDAVPAILHGGERVIPRNGVDVNNGGGGVSTININFDGPVYMDDDSRIQDIANKIASIIGRQNELAGKAVGY